MKTKLLVFSEIYIEVLQIQNDLSLAVMYVHSSVSLITEPGNAFTFSTKL